MAPRILLTVPFNFKWPIESLKGEVKSTGRAIFFFSALSITFITSLTSLVLHLVFDHISRLIPILGLIVVLNNLFWLPLDYFLKRRESNFRSPEHQKREQQQQQQLQQQQQNRPSLPPSHLSRTPFWRGIAAESFWIMNWMMLFATIVNCAIVSTRVRFPVTIINIVVIVSQGILCAAFSHLCWPTAHRASRSALLVCSSTELFFSVYTLITNITLQRTPISKRPTIILQLLAAQTFAVSVIGFGVTASVRNDDRANRFLVRMTRFHAVSTVFAVVLNIAGFSLILKWWMKIENTHPPTQQALAVDTIFAAIDVLVLIIGAISAHLIHSPSTSNLSCEEINLSTLSQYQREEYGKLITLYGGDRAVKTSGAAMMELMMAYQHSKLNNMECKVLRVFNSAKEQVKENTVGMEAEFGRKSYENVSSWRNLDEDFYAFEEESQVQLIKKACGEPATPAPPRISKKQKLKQAKLAATAGIAAAGGSNSTTKIQMESVRTKEEIQADKVFKAKLEATEALVLLTTINNYDLTASVPGLSGRILTSTLGSKSWFKPLCVRLGLLATHWPFRRAVFYTSSTKKPVARSAAVARAITEWNEKLPRKSRYGMFLDPIYQYDSVKRAISPAGWQSIPLPASHIIDLRPHRNSTITEYLKNVKYKRQDGPFNNAGGTVEVTQDFSAENVKVAFELWKNVAEKRTGDGNTEVLATPDETFFSALGHPVSNTRGDRTLMFLKLGNGQVIASCVLFRLGDIITSDLQGLEYEHGRPVKAYFVMMQQVIELALNENLSYVDFGPTAEQPKVAIGCRVVDLVGAVYARSSLLSLGIGLAAKCIQTNS